MGYYTDYSLAVYGISVSGDTVTTSSVPTIVRNDLVAEIDKMGVFSQSDVEYGWYANAKWYDYADDMKYLSSKFPEVLFELHGAGEDQEDMWYAYFHDGREQHCPAVITYDDFCLSKLGQKETFASDTKYSYQS